MGIFKAVFKKKENEGMIVGAPAAGYVKPLEGLKDGVFSERLLGEGCVISPMEETIYAPFDGKVILVTETKHAIGLMSDDGIELLIHVGLDTVMMAGEGFTMMVEKGESVKQGDRLISFSTAKIKAAGYLDDVIVIVSNTKCFQGVACTQKEVVEANDELIRIMK